jgi:hypothetical protein
MTMYIPKMNDKTLCNFTRIADNKWKCSKCQQVIGISDGGHPPPIPCKSTIKDFINSDEHDVELKNLIRTRYQICQSCAFFKNNICNKCGCLISTNTLYTNKLADVNDRCPEGKW